MTAVILDVKGHQDPEDYQDSRKSELILLKLVKEYVQGFFRKNKREKQLYFMGKGYAINQRIFSKQKTKIIT